MSRIYKQEFKFYSIHTQCIFNEADSNLTANLIQSVHPIVTNFTEDYGKLPKLLIVVPGIDCTNVALE